MSANINFQNRSNNEQSTIESSSRRGENARYKINAKNTDTNLTQKILDASKEKNHKVVLDMIARANLPDQLNSIK